MTWKEETFWNCLSTGEKNPLLQNDSRKRTPYIAYLTRCRQGLQTSQAHLERLLQRVLRDKEVANRYFTTVCVRLLLEHMESKMLDFIKGMSSLFLVLSDFNTAKYEVLSDEKLSLWSKP